MTQDGRRTNLNGLFKSLHKKHTNEFVADRPLPTRVLGSDPGGSPNRRAYAGRRGFLALAQRAELESRLGSRRRGSKLRKNLKPWPAAVKQLAGALAPIEESDLETLEESPRRAACRSDPTRCRLAPHFSRSEPNIGSESPGPGVPPSFATDDEECSAGSESGVAGLVVPFASTATRCDAEGRLPVAWVDECSTMRSTRTYLKTATGGKLEALAPAAVSFPIVTAPGQEWKSLLTQARNAVTDSTLSVVNQEHHEEPPPGGPPGKCAQRTWRLNCENTPPRSNASFEQKDAAPGLVSLATQWKTRPGSRATKRTPESRPSRRTLRTAMDRTLAFAIFRVWNHWAKSNALLLTAIWSARRRRCVFLAAGI